ncbi:hypothetical protein H5410_041928 [Solanum commersonii]|uniref:Uncharacterized protein n=1 Tax=Solanum commersonii TaxID=4109 RepID=A0A9J5XX10_SOLCO|nr:hypothetical protein H5410_041928 [Solanum commersonii]
MSYFELRDYIKELGYSVNCDFFIKWDGLLVLVNNDKVIFDLFNMINDGDIVEVYVFHGVSKANQAPLELDFVPDVSDSEVGEEFFNEASNPNNQPATSTFPSIPTTGPSETSNTPFDDQSTTVPPPCPSSIVPPPSPSTVPPSSIVPSTVPPSSIVPSTVDSDVHQEYIDIRASKRHFKSSQRRSRGTTSNQINVDEKGPDIGYDETNIGIRESLVGKLGGDEAPNFEIDVETGWGDSEEIDQVVHKPISRKKTPNRVVFDTSSEKIVWELGLVFGAVKEFRVAVTRYAVQEHIQILKYELKEEECFRGLLNPHLKLR